MLSELVGVAAATAVRHKEELLAENSTGIVEMRIDFWRAGSTVATIHPREQTIPALATALRVGASGFEADAVIVCQEVWLVPQHGQSNVHPVTGQPLATGDVAVLLAADGYRRGLVTEGVLVIGANRAGDLDVQILVFTSPSPGRIAWDLAPQQNIDSVRDGELGDVLRSAMMQPTVLQLGSQQFPIVTDTSQYPQERLDCLAAAFLSYEHGCRVQVLAQPEDLARRVGLAHWASEDWKWKRQ